VINISFKNQNRTGYLIGVLDGHNGSYVADLCASLIPTLFDSENPDPAQELCRLVQILHECTQARAEGSTLSLAYINESDRSVVTAVLGDSPIIVIDANGQIHVSEGHSVYSNIAEREAVIRRGGAYDDQGGYIHNAPDNDYGLSSDFGLQMSRALGDSHFRRILDREPTIARHSLGRASAVLVASDGLIEPWRSASSARLVGEIAEMMIHKCPASKILKWRELDEFDDNTSLILWHLFS
jgi:serine/threonine protein phosphatase PrpC